jgi:hypothetical protein
MSKGRIQIGDYQQGLEYELISPDHTGVELQVKFTGGELWLSSEDFPEFKEELKELLERYFI